MLLWFVSLGRWVLHRLWGHLVIVLWLVEIETGITKEAIVAWLISSVVAAPLLCIDKWVADAIVPQVFIGEHVALHDQKSRV